MGNEFYAPSAATQEAARSSGFTRLFLCAAYVDASGDLFFNSTPVVQRGAYIGDPTWAAKLAALKAQPTSLDRLEIVIGGGTDSSFANISNLLASYGTGTNSPLYQNFLALKEATGADAIQFNDNQTFDASSSVAFGQLLAALDLKVTLCPSNSPAYWTRVKAELGTNVDAIYLQCYQGGTSNDPAAWNEAFGGFKTYPGLWGNTDSPSSATGKMRKWQTTLGITGGFMWLNGYMPGDSPKWSQALTYGLDPLCSFRIVNKNSGKAMGLVPGALENGSTMDQWGYSTSGSQQWSLVPTDEGDHYKIMSWACGRCASIAQSTMAAGGRLWAWDYNSDPSQEFDLVPADPGWLKIKNVRSGLVLEVAGGSRAEKALIQQNADTGAANQQWKLYPNKDAVLAYESFDYLVGNLSGQHGGEGWNGNWLDDFGASQVLPESLTGATNVPPGYDAQSSGNSAFIQCDRRIGRYLDCSLNGNFGIYGYLDANGRIGAEGKTLYLSFLQQPVRTLLFYELELNRETTRIAGIGNDTGTGNVCLRAPDGVFTPLGVGDTNVNFYVMRIDFKATNDDVRVYRNPTSTEEPALATLTLTNVADMSFDRISMGAFANANGVKHDQIRIATSWQYALGAAPESVIQASSNLICDGIFRRARLSAQVLYGNGQMYYLTDGNIGIRALLSRPMLLEPGDLLDVVGLVQRSKQAMVLMEAVPQKTGHASLPKAQPLPPEDTARQSDWVWVEAILTGVDESGAERILKLQMGSRSLQARLRINQPAVDWSIGSRLKLTGVYLPQAARQPGAANENAIELLLNSPDDVEVIARPPWWTLRRVVVMVSLLVAVLALAFIWITLLRRQVEQHARRLKREITEREQAERARIIEEERSRISRDLHDDLGSLLTQVRMLATFSPGLKISLQTARERIGLIADKSYHMIVALDEVVWMMNPKNESLSSLAAYLAAYAEEFLSKTDITCRIETPPSFPKATISAEERNNLFSALKEAINNAVRHGKPSQISLKLSIAGQLFEIQLHDNGSGFDPLTAVRGDGLSNLQARMFKIKGQCQIKSAPEAGTTVTLQLPLQ